MPLSNCFEIRLCIHTVQSSLRKKLEQIFWHLPWKLREVLRCYISIRTRDDGRCYSQKGKNRGSLWMVASFTSDSPGFLHYAAVI